MYVVVDHPRFARAETAIFTSRVVADCMSHACKMHERPHLEACCQYGCDVHPHERVAIEARADEIRRVLHSDARWFDDDDPEIDPDVGVVVRTEVVGTGCVFLQHDQRGCAIHRAGLAGGWDWRAVKPHVCQLFPLTYTSDAIVISEDYADYSCAYEPNAPTLYRVAREALAYHFGDPLVRALDAAEARVLATRLPLA